MPDSAVHPRCICQTIPLPRAASEAPLAQSTSLARAWQVLWRRRRFIAVIEGALLAACVLYCLIAPNQYEAAARVELRTAPVSSLSLEARSLRFRLRFSPRPSRWKLWPAFCAATGSPGA